MLKSRDITLLIKAHLVKAMVFPVIMYGCESWTIKKVESQRIDAFELWCWRRLLRVCWTPRRLNQSILKETSPEYSLEGLMLKLKLQYFGHRMRRSDSLEDSDAGKDWRQEEKGMTEDEMVGWHHQLNGHEFEQAPGVSHGQGGPACCNSWGRKESDTTERLNWLTVWGWNHPPPHPLKICDRCGLKSHIMKLCRESQEDSQAGAKMAWESKEGCLSLVFTVVMEVVRSGFYMWSRAYRV